MARDLVMGRPHWRARDNLQAIRCHACHKPGKGRIVRVKNPFGDLYAWMDCVWIRPPARWFVTGATNDIDGKAGFLFRCPDCCKRKGSHAKAAKKCA
jgi:hypothetical protein